MEPKFFITLIACLIFVLPSLEVSAQEQRVRFGVIALDDTEDARESTQGVVRTLDSKSYEVLDPYAIEQELEKARVPKPSAELGQQFTNYTNSINEGIKAYFYDGAKLSIELLGPIFDAGITSRDMLAYRPDRSAQIYETGVVLLRSYQDIGQKDNAQAVASLLARHFPHHLPSTGSTPPETRALVEKRISTLLDPATSIVLRPLGEARECATFLNGIALEQGKPVPVDPELDYFITLDCPSTSPAIWKLRPTENMRLEVPLVVGSPLDVAIKDGSQTSRRVAEDALRAIRFWSGLDLMVGVSHLAAKDTDATVLLVRVESSRMPLWSDETSKKGVATLLPSLLPEYLDEQPSAMVGRTSTSRKRSKRKVLPIVMTGLGVVGAGAGGYLAITGNRDLQRAVCSEANEAKDIAACADVENAYTYEELGSTPEEQVNELQTRLDSATRQRNIGIGVLAAGGVMAIGGSVWWAMSGRSKEAPSALLVVPSKNGLELGWSVSF